MPFFKKRFSLALLSILLCLGFTCLVLTVFLRVVDLRPKVDETFFFSSRDPQLAADNRISKMFPQSSQIILVVRGDIHSPEYFAGIKKLTEELGALPQVFSVQSLARGPDDPQSAFESPLWKRVLISDDGKSSFVFVSIQSESATQIVSLVEKMRHRFEGPGFHVILSGVPYITELIVRNLQRDLKVFSLAAFCVFGIVLFLIFRSLPILLGTFVTCLNSSALTLIVTHWVNIPIGPLTANLSTMVFVLTLSPIVFLTFNWKQVCREEKAEGLDVIGKAVKRTMMPSFWSMTTQLAGFVSLLFVPSTPMRHLGISGAIGSFIAFVAAYTIYPWFLQMTKASNNGGEKAGGIASGFRSFFSQRHGRIAAVLIVFTLIAACGLPRLNTDPDLPSYFKKGGEIRTGLEYADRNGGSSPLRLVVMDRDKTPMKTGKDYEKLWRLHEALEQDPAVGTVVSLPLVLEEAKRSPLTILISTEWLLNILEGPKYGAVTKYFVTEDRTKNLFLLRMKETNRKDTRQDVIERLKRIVDQQGFTMVLAGGTYSLQGQLSLLLTSSIISGVLLLIGLFVLMGWGLSRSLQVSLAFLISLTMIPVIIRGYIAFLRIPLDFITASAANLDIGMGVDAMIYLCMSARRLSGKEPNAWKVWSQACSQLWEPIGTSLVVICSGFGIFMLSNFPPTQRFGFFVIFGSVAAALAALFVFPWISSATLRKQPSPS